MACHICGQEAVSRCYNCGELFCAEHGDENCTRCTSAIKAGDPRQDRISAVRLRDGSRAAWWRPQPAEEYMPPSCATCKGMARFICVNCHERYCSEHAGPGGTCAACAKSSHIGLFILAIVGGLFILLMIYHLADRAL